MAKKQIEDNKIIEIVKSEPLVKKIDCSQHIQKLEACLGGFDRLSNDDISIILSFLKSI